MAKLRWGEGRHQIYILRPEITSYLRAGKTCGQIYKLLKEDNRFSGGRRTLERHVRKIKEHLSSPEDAHHPTPTHRSIIYAPTRSAEVIEASLEDKSSSDAALVSEDTALVPASNRAVGLKGAIDMQKEPVDLNKTWKGKK